ncbi:MAG: hypothetical protein HY913_04155 [Desulfomonile tiedjei]|nr:hypothetical protein [Desulfomonile tiedjei]
MKTSFCIMVMVALFAQGAVVIAEDGSSEGTGQIKWLNGIDAALSQAKSENKPVFLDFFNPN